VKRLRATLVWVWLVVPAVAGCGSSAPPPFSLTCKLHRLPTGAVRAAVTVTNNTGNASGAIIYGPALRWVTHEYPLLATRFVIDRTNGRQTSYIGFAVPGVKAKGARTLLLRFRPPRPLGLLVTITPRVENANLQNPDCLIKQPKQG
jgi:hypothetical protein